MSDSVKDLRAATLEKTPQFRSKFVEVNGKQFEMRQITIGERMALRDACTDKATDKLDYFQFMYRGIIASCFVPGSSEKVFSDGDYSLFLKQAPGGWLDKLQEAFTDLAFLEQTEKSD